MLAFLRNLLGPALDHPPLRPPGAIAEEDFVRRCIKCGQCAQVCAFESIEMTTLSWGAKSGTPVVFARETPCYLCMECPPVCPTGALDPATDTMQAVKMGLAVVNEDLCLPFMGVICRSCFDSCPLFREAILMREDKYPVVVEEKCTGCGICEHVCVAEKSAIVVRSRHDV